MPTFSPFRGIGRTYLAGLVDKGLSANKSLKLLRSAGLGYRRQDFLRDFKEWRRLGELKETFKYIPKSRKPTMGTITKTEESLTKEYSYIFDIKGKDSLTGRDKIIHWRHSTDDLVTLSEAEDVVDQYMQENKYKQDITAYTINTIGVKQSITL